MKIYLKYFKKDDGLLGENSKILQLYLDACDEKNIRSAFLKFWTVAEKVTQISSTDKHSKVVERLLKFVRAEDRGYFKMMLTNIALNRNLVTHEGEASDFSTIQTLVYQIHDFIHYMIVFCLSNDMNFNDAEELRRYLDLPRNLEDLEVRQKLLEKAIEHRLKYP